MRDSPTKTSLRKFRPTVVFFAEKTNREPVKLNANQRFGSIQRLRSLKSA